MSRLRSPFVWFVLAILTTAALTAIGPEEQSLGENARIIYLQRAWRVSAEAVLGLAALSGLAGILSRRYGLHRWSAALGRTGIFFWVVYLPLLSWAGQADWGELFSQEPFFRVAVIFAAVGVMLQIGLSLLAKPAMTSLTNFTFFIALWIAKTQAEHMNHPSFLWMSEENTPAFQLFFIGLVLLTMAAAYFMTKWWLARQSPEQEEKQR